MFATFAPLASSVARAPAAQAPMRERSRLTACPQPNDFLAGAFTGKGDVANDPALKFLHGTTTLGFIFNGGIVLAVDSRASMGSYIGAPALLSLLSMCSHPS
jgi:hypothetical protein